MDESLPPVVFTIGHSTRPLEDFLALLMAHDIALLADVRTMPRSRHNPQFNSDTLASALREKGVDYMHFADLGGLRRRTPDSPNGGWRNASFQGYADYMQTPAFAEALDLLLARAAHERTALMCAEAVPWRCHRSLIADALTVRHIPVIDILSNGHTQPHALTPFAHVEGLHITYPPLKGTQQQEFHLA